MSWLQLLGETWPASQDEADLRVFILPPDVGCPRVGWYLELSHTVQPATPPAPGEPKLERWVDVELGPLILNLNDWRRLAGLEIRADAAWHATQEFAGPYGYSYQSPRVVVHRTVLRLVAGVEAADAGSAGWIAHDFLLRFGNRDGWSFPLELDAWLIPEKEYYRLTPETAEETARFGEGAPQLQIVTRANFVGGGVHLTRRAAEDPVAGARASLFEQVRCEAMREPELKWALRHTPDREEIVPMPGWRSTVYFNTGYKA